MNAVTRSSSSESVNGNERELTRGCEPSKFNTIAVTLALDT